MTDKFDPNVVITAANDKLQASGDLEGGQLIFQSALLTWVDDARESLSSTSNEDAMLQKEAIATLWLAYAQFLASAKQFKSATEAYEQAVSCPIAHTSGRVWLEYARFAEERNKRKTMQDIFIRALVGNLKTGDPPPMLDEQDQQLLWNEFLEMMRTSSNNPTLTLSQLQQAVLEDHGGGGSGGDGGGATAATDASIMPPETQSSSAASSSSLLSPPLKRPRLDGPPMPIAALLDTKTFVVTEDAVQSQGQAFAEYLLQGPLPAEISAAWMLRDGTELAVSPPSLFTPSPPKLSDPTGKDLIGLETALHLLQTLVEYGSIVLPVCEGLWTLQALSEQDTQSSLEQLDATLLSQAQVLHTTLCERLAVSNDATRAAVTLMNQHEWAAFRQNCENQRHQTLSQIAWEHRRVLCVQQQVLSKLGIPEFGDGPTVDPSALERQCKVCSYLHSAFYLRSRIGETPHVTMLQSQIKRLEKEVESSSVAARSYSPLIQDARYSPVPPHHAGGNGRLSPAPRSPYNTATAAGGTASPMMASMSYPPQQHHAPGPPPPPSFPYPNQPSMPLHPNLQPMLPPPSMNNMPGGYGGGGGGAVGGGVGSYMSYPSAPLGPGMGPIPGLPPPPSTRLPNTPPPPPLPPTYNARPPPPYPSYYPP